MHMKIADDAFIQLGEFGFVIDNVEITEEGENKIVSL